MTLKTDRSTLDTSLLPNGQQREYLVLSDEELAKGFVRPLRQLYRHVGPARPRFPLRDLTPEESERYDGEFSKFETYPESEAPKTGRYWTREELHRIAMGACGTTMRMAIKLAETYARSPNFYSGTFCVKCGTHFPVGEDGEFVWVDDYGNDGPRVGT